MTCPTNLPEFLPGRFLLQRGDADDYRTLRTFHYAAGPPATWAGIWTIRYVEPACRRVAAVGVLSWPVPSCHPRERCLGLRGSRAENLRFANAHIRTISRVIVHPQFRSLGLARVLVRHMCLHAPTRYVEAIAQMGHVHPLFERGGMKRVNPQRLDEPAYFIFDRQTLHTLSGVNDGFAHTMPQRRRAA